MVWKQKAIDSSFSLLRGWETSLSQAIELDYNMIWRKKIVLPNAEAQQFKVDKSSVECDSLISEQLSNLGILM